MLPLWVSAEISDIKLNRSGHCYIELIEKSETSAATTAQARAVIWSSNYARILSYFEAESGGKLERGVKILAKVMVGYHEIYGLSLTITDIDPSYTLGEMERRRQLAIAQLKKDGVWDLNREQPLTRLVQSIAVISSPSAAGYQDFHREISASGFYFDLTLFEAVMQGSTAEESIISALELIAERDEEFDAVVIIRGGGSTSDLNCFDSYRLASHVAQFPLPILAGIGHDKDISVVDMVAHNSLKTPTAVAGWLVERMQSIEGWLDGAATMLMSASARLTRSHEILLERLSSEIRSSAATLIALGRQRLAQSEENIISLANDKLRRESERITMLKQIIEAAAPERMLKLGFAIVRPLSGGKTINSTGEVELGSELRIELNDGAIETTITKIVGHK